MKQRPVLSLPKGRLALILGVFVLAALLSGCAGTVGSRGWAPPVRTDDELLVSTGKGRLDSLDADTYEGLWRFPNQWDLSGAAGRLSGIYGPPVVNADGVVFVGDYNGYVYAFRPADLSRTTEGEPPAASFKLSEKIIGGVALDEASDTLFVAAGSSLYAIRADDLVARIRDEKASVTVARLFKAGGEIWSTPVLASGKLLVSSLDGNLYAVDARSGSQLWRFSAGKSLASTPVVSGGVVLVGGFDGRLHAVDLDSGDEAWSFTASNWVWSRPYVAGERVYFGDFDGNLYAVELSSGTLAWKASLGRGAIRGSPVITAGVVVVATEEGWLLGIDPSSQAKRWEKELDASLNGDLVADGETVLIAPSGCVTPAGTEEKVYYASVNAATGELRSASGVC
ncbi:MAG TPA: PQQ-binding-like beta-propeller repeat protein [Dehalococcoidia bacterium]